VTNRCISAKRAYACGRPQGLAIRHALERHSGGAGNGALCVGKGNAVHTHTHTRTYTAKRHDTRQRAVTNSFSCTLQVFAVREARRASCVAEHARGSARSPVSRSWA
jgi:hypothetical protein